MAQRKCGLCGEEGHDKRTCPEQGLAGLFDNARTIAYCPGLVGIVGDVKTTLFLSQALFWWEIAEKNEECPADEDGRSWFRKTARQWKNETGLTYEIQKTARKKLVDLEILHEKTVEYQLWYWVDWEKVLALGYTASSRCVAYRTVFLTFMDFLPALFLSQAVHQQGLAGEREWWPKARETWETETGLTLRQQGTARRELKKLGMLKEKPIKRPGRPDATYFRVDERLLAATLTAIIATYRGGSGKRTAI